MWHTWLTCGLMMAAILFPVVTSSCEMSDTVCEFWLDVTLEVTMVDKAAVPPKAVYTSRGQLYHYDVTNTTAASPVDPSNVIIANGWEEQRLVIAVNGSMPGPPIEVYTDQTVLVHVKNHLHSESITVHWHGLHQEGTPWMDGVAFVTQCPIPPHSTFTYKFRASPQGSFWYHAHIGSQMSMGLLGPLVVRERRPQAMDDFVLMIQEWNHDIDAEMIDVGQKFGLYEGRRELPRFLPSIEGGLFSSFPTKGGLINGLGRVYQPDGSHNEAPLTRYTVSRGQSYRFRIIGAGGMFPWRMSIDGHSLTVVASDGYDLEPVVVESVIINPGERYDVIITADQPESSYWIRGVTLVGSPLEHYAVAVLQYMGGRSTGADPTTSRKQCTPTDRCLVANCHFPNYPGTPNTDCLSAGDLRSKVDSVTPGTGQGHREEIEEIFLNFGYAGEPVGPNSVNGRSFVPHPFPPLTQPLDVRASCDPQLCGEEKTCYCPYTLDLQYNKVYQFVFVNMGKSFSHSHPIHMHGHSFHVLKTGYPTYNSTTGKLLGLNQGDNTDINCRGNPDRSKTFCNAATWADPTWRGNSVPGLELDRPPRKDTIMVPAGGYVVVRIRADNPGLWFIHCHIETHSNFGMAMMLNESYHLVPKAPAGFPTCGDFTQSRGPVVREEEESDGEYGGMFMGWWRLVSLFG